MLREKCFRRKWRSDKNLLIFLSKVCVHHDHLIIYFFSFSPIDTTSQEQEKKDLMDFLTMTTNIIKGIRTVCFIIKFYVVFNLRTSLSSWMTYFHLSMNKIFKSFTITQSNPNDSSLKILVERMKDHRGTFSVSDMFLTLKIKK